MLVFFFRYKKFKLGADIELVVRCEHDAVTQGPSGELAYMNVKSLNEWDSKVSSPKSTSIYSLTRHAVTNLVTFSA